MLRLSTTYLNSSEVTTPAGLSKSTMERLDAAPKDPLVLDPATIPGSEGSGYKAYLQRHTRQ